MDKRIYTTVRIYGYSNIDDLTTKITEFIEWCHGRGRFAEIQYTMNNSVVSALCLEYE